MFFTNDYILKLISTSKKPLYRSTLCCCEGKGCYWRSLGEIRRFGNWVRRKG